MLLRALRSRRRHRGLDTRVDTRLTLAESTESAQPRRSDAIARGSLVGRYVVVDRLGAGAMGIVYAAYDPELDRRVALKLLQQAPDDSPDDSRSRTRLLREAQALARLSHPNVVAVHDVGTYERSIHGGTSTPLVFIAMELVDGTTLSQWLKARPRTWREVLATILPAGHGVAAAHAQGLVHGDLKPDNVMIASDGRIRVMDFGLARPRARGTSGDAGDSSPPRGTELSASNDALATPLTRVGTLVGTPAYMAPEQFSGARGDPRSDQFSFCVTLWEAFFGERPFRGDTLANLAFAVSHGELVVPPGATKVPAWLRRVLARGLAADPEARWPDMGELLRALEQGQSAASRRRALTAGVLALAATGAVILVQRSQHAAAVAACAREGEEIAQVWNAAELEAVEAAAGATGAAFAASTGERLAPWLDAYAGDWSTARTEVCVQDLESGEDETWTRARQCLDERRLDLDALVERLGRADLAALQSALEAAAALPPIDACRDPAVLTRRPLPPEDRLDEVRAIKAELARAGAARHAGDFAEALEIAAAARDRAEALAWPPLRAEALLVFGGIARHGRTREEGEAALADAFFAAQDAAVPEVASDAASQLVYLLGYLEAREREALTWARHAQTQIAQVEPEAGLRAARLASHLGAVSHAAGRFEAAREHHERALALHEAVLGPAHPTIGVQLANLAGALLELGELDTAREALERSLAIRERVFGPDHPELASSLNNLAAVDRLTGDHRGALARMQRVVALKEAAFGSRSPEVAGALDNLALIQFSLGDLDDAVAGHERALSIREEVLGPEHVDVAYTLDALGGIYLELDDTDRARAAHTRALAILERERGPDHPDVARTVGNLANVAYQLRELDTALPLHERAAKIREATLGPDHRDVGVSLGGLATTLHAMGEHERAYEAFARSIPILARRLSPNHHELRQQLENLTKVLVSLGDDALAAKRWADAERWFAGALVLRARLPEYPEQHAWATRGLARAREEG